MNFSDTKPFKVSLTLHVLTLGVLGLATILQGCFDQTKTIEVFELVQIASDIAKPPAPETVTHAAFKSTIKPPEIDPIRPASKPPAHQKPRKTTPKPPAPPPEKVTFDSYSKNNPRPKPPKKTTPRPQPQSQPQSQPQRQPPKTVFNTQDFEKTLKQSMQSIRYVASSDNAQVTRAQQDALDRFAASLADAIRSVWQKPNQLGEGIVEIRVESNGTLRGRIIKSSGNNTFDQSILNAIQTLGKFTIPPGGKAVTIQSPFSAVY